MCPFQEMNSGTNWGRNSGTKFCQLNCHPGSKQSQSERIKKYFALLDKETRQRLYQVYRIDFEMFGFDATSYL